MKKPFVFGLILPMILAACSAPPAPEAVVITVAAVEPAEVVSAPTLAPTATVVVPTATFTAEPTDPPTPTFTPTVTIIPVTDTPEIPTNTPVPTIDPNIDWTTVSTRLDDGRMALGNPDAPVTIIDYSDFL